MRVYGARRATVRIGLYDKKTSTFFSYASGALVSGDGHILTAAHTFLGPMPNGRPNQEPPPLSVMFGHPVTGFPRFGHGGSGEDDEFSRPEELMIAIGMCAYCRLHTAYCILHTTYCMMHTAYYIPRTAYCILHTASSLPLSPCWLSLLHSAAYYTHHTARSTLS